MSSETGTSDSDQVARARFAVRRRAPLDRVSLLLVAIGAMLWASDVFFRTGLVRRGVTSSEVVFAEDLLISLAFVPFWMRIWRDLRGHSTRTALALLLIGVGPQALATVLFTQSISIALQSAAVSETYLLQQVQPLIAVALAWLVLKERRRAYFWPLAAVGLAAVYMVVFADAPLQPLADLQRGRVLAAVCALGAALLWASGTVLGRYALRDVSFVTTAALRFTVALPVLLVIMLVSDGPSAFGAYRASDLPDFVGLAVLPGLGAILLYYRALRSTPASLATLAETAYPLTVTLLLALPAPYGFRQQVFPLQILGTALFIGVIIALNASKERVVVEARPALHWRSGGAAFHRPAG
ncbi:MAG: DMT family transporter [Candidatus Dormibacteria bacterium]